MSEQHNPKYVEANKRGKIDYSVVPWAAIIGLAQAMSEGAGKYGRFNFRQDRIEARTYIAAILRHLFGDPSTGSVGWINGEDIDEESGLHHLDKVMACCLLVRDAQDHGMLIDNRLDTESITPGTVDAVTEDGIVDFKFAEPPPDIHEDMRKFWGFDDRPFRAGDFAVFPMNGDFEVRRREDPLDIDFNLLDDVAKIHDEIDARARHRHIPLEPGFYVEFRDASPGVDEEFTTVIGPYNERRTALDVRKYNPGNFAGTSLVFEIR